MKFARGLTLLELLAAVALLSVFVSGVGAWMVSVSRAGVELDREVQERSVLERTLTAIEDDIHQAWIVKQAGRESEGVVPAIEFDELSHRIVLVTSSRIDPTEEYGWLRVEWVFDRDARVLRRVSAPVRGDRAEAARDALRGVVRFRVAEAVREGEENGTDGVAGWRAVSVEVELESGAAMSVITGVAQ